MALTFGAQKRYNIGGRWQAITSLTLDASYPTGGYAVTGQQLGLPAGLVDYVDLGSASNGGYQLSYNYATGKIQAFQGAAAAPSTEVPNATNLSAVTPTAMVIGL